MRRYAKQLKGNPAKCDDWWLSRRSSIGIVHDTYEGRVYILVVDGKSYGFQTEMGREVRNNTTGRRSIKKRVMGNSGVRSGKVRGTRDLLEESIK